MLKLTHIFFMLAVFSAKTYAGNLPENILHLPIPLMSGQETSLAAYQGKKPVYIRFWASW